MNEDFSQKVDQWKADIIARGSQNPFEALRDEVLQFLDAAKQYLICENPWCEAKVPLSEYTDHLSICSPKRWHKCIRCNQRVDNDKMQQHRANCTLVVCQSCGEFVFPRMLQLCPKLLLQPRSNSPHPETSLSTTPRADREVTWSPHDDNVKNLQALWRTFNARRRFQNLAFRLVWDRMEFARETKLAKGANHSESLSAYSSWTRRSSSVTVLSPKGSNLKPSSIETLERLESEIQREHTPEDFATLLKLVEHDSIVPYDIADDLVRDATRILRLRPSVCNVAIPTKGEVIVVGDLHGQLKDLLHILRAEGLPSAERVFVFNGDFVDRGPQGCEVLLLLFALLCTFPQQVFLNRGNHEDRNTNREYGFLVEVQTKYEDSDIFDEISKAYRVMPLVHVVDSRILVVHGGLPRQVVPLQRINHIGHIRDIPTCEQIDEDDELLVDLLWSDPVEHFKSRSIGLRHVGANWRTSSRGCGVEYTAAHTEEFLQHVGLEMVVRSHEMVAGGYQVMHNGKSITVFSASDYCGVSMNRAAIIAFNTQSPDPSFRTWFLRESLSKRHRRRDESPPDTPLELHEPAVPMHLLSMEQGDCLSQIREFIWSNRFTLMSNFSSSDIMHVGYVTKVEWSEIMRRVSLLPLPWYFLCPFIADVVTFQEIPAVKYTQFLASVDSRCGCQHQVAWVEEKIQAIFSELDLPSDLQERRSTGDRFRAQSFTDFSPLLRSSPSSDIIDFNTFCITVRTKSKIAARLDDNELFIIFLYFDRRKMGHVSILDVTRVAESLIDEEESVEVVDGDQLRKGAPGKGWMYQSMMQLQHFFLFGQRRGLQATFRLLDRDGNGSLDFGEFKKVLRRLNKQLQHPIDEAQMEEMFLVVDVDGNGSVDIDEFVGYFSVLDLRDQTRRMSYVDRVKADIAASPKTVG